MKRFHLYVLTIGVCLAVHSTGRAACTGDADADGVCDNVDVCPLTVPGSVVDAVGCPLVIPGDADRDGDVDIGDYLFMSACVSGPATAASPVCQSAGFDLDNDADIDMADFAIFEQCFSGQDQPADCGGHQVFIADGCLNIIGTVAGTTLSVGLRPGAPTIIEVDIDDDDFIEHNFRRADVDCIIIDARGGDDVVLIDESNGIFTNTEPTTIYGGSGDDELYGGSGGEDFIPGPGNDIVLMGAGDDRFVWIDGDDTDLVEGEAGVDDVEVHGSDLAEHFTVTANGTRVRFDRLNPHPFSLDLGACENLIIQAHGGDDTTSATGNLAALITITADGGDGDDTLLGGNGGDVLIGGEGADFIDGQQGSDLILLGAGDDVFQWDPGDGNDTIEGQDGTDAIHFNGSSGDEIFDFSPNGQRVRFTRNLGNIVLDIDDVESFELRALAGADTVIASALDGTALVDVTVQLAASGGTGDGQADNIIINGTNGDDVVLMDSAGDGATVRGLAAALTITGAESANDRVTIELFGGDDVVDASGLATASIQLFAHGGPGDDILLGGAGADVLTGDDNDDALIGGPGIDVLDGGVGDNVVLQDGNTIATAIVTIFGTADADSITISRDSEGNILSNGVPIPGATVANTAVIRIFGLAGDDQITLDEVNGALPIATVFGGAGADTLTGGSAGNLLFGGADGDMLLAQGGSDFLFGGGGDDSLTGGDAGDLAFGQAGSDRFIWNPGDDTDLNEGGSGTDTVEVNGAGGDEQFTVTANGTRVRFDRLNPAPFSLDIGTSENLVLHAGGGNDTCSCTGNLAALIQITADGGPGQDTLLGSNGNDLLIGGDDNDFIDGQQGADVVFLGAGFDVFNWDPGDGSDVVEGQDDFDVIKFNGSGGSEIFDFSPNGFRLRLARNLGNIVMDIGGVEQVDLQALGGADVVTVNNLDATEIVRVNVDLAASLGGTTGDSQVDQVVVNGTSQADAITVISSIGAVEVGGLPTTTRITRSEATLDQLTINGLGGSDTFTTGPGVGSLIMVTTNQ